MGKGMDGAAGKDIVIQVPCGTLVWKLRDTKPAAEDDDDEDEDSKNDKADRNVISSSTGQRPVIRVAGGMQAKEYNLADEPEIAPRHDDAKGELVADLTTHGQRFILCKAGRGGLG